MWFNFRFMTYLKAYFDKYCTLYTKHSNAMRVYIIPRQFTMYLLKNQ